MTRTQRTTLISLSLAGLWLLLVAVVWAQTPGDLAIEVNRHEVLFGQSLRFYLTAASTSDITSAILTYRTADNQGMTVQQSDFAPAPRVELLHEIDLSRQPIKQFVQVEYWWTVRDAAGHQLVTEHQQFFYQDNRFAWQELPGRRAVVHWYDGDLTFSSLALDVADQAVDRLQAWIDPALALPQPFHLYLYASEADLLPALPATGREWVVGQAYPELRLAVAAIPSGPEGASTARWLIPHELTHLVLYEALGSSYGRLPAWFNEGLAVLNEQAPDPDDALALEQALQNDQLLSLDGLCHSFPRQGDQVRLAYAQSASVVQFIQDNYGRSAIGRLVAAYRDDLSCNSGVRRALGISLASLESQWRASLGARPKTATLLKQAAPWLLLMLAGLPLLLMIVYPLLARRSQAGRERSL